MKEVEFPKLKPANLAALLPTCVALNYAGGMIRQMLNVPLFLDTGGTLLATFIAGPWVGLLCAALNAVVMAITLGPLQLLTVIPTGIIALIVGFSAKKGYTRTWFGLILTLIVEQPFACVASAYIYTYIYGGFSGGGLDIMHAVFMQATSSIFASSFISELVTGFLDKFVLTIVLMLIFRALPEKYRVTTPFSGSKVAEEEYE
ncbi:MAG: hypothetical protein E7193_04305 [Erysipelotrichaceae bacterium]|nr:hypothetical protein [Erysipelotrichaceae bacterium]MBQ1314796.1 hypothetical protein [Erysipelotrichaceae bacterium]